MNYSDFILITGVFVCLFVCMFGGGREEGRHPPFDITLWNNQNAPPFRELLSVWFSERNTLSHLTAHCLRT
jgi:hypothetical protein